MRSDPGNPSEIVYAHTHTHMNRSCLMKKELYSSQVLRMFMGWNTASNALRMSKAIQFVDVMTSDI